MSASFLAATTLLLLALLVVVFPLGARVLVTPPFWWIVAAAIYTLPALWRASDGVTSPLLSVVVSFESIRNYSLFVGCTSLSLALGWRTSAGRWRGKIPYRLPSLDFRLGRLYILESMGAVGVVGSAILSGIPPGWILTTLSDKGYTYYQQGEYRFLIFSTIGWPLVTFMPPLILSSLRGNRDFGLRLLAWVNYSGVFLLLVLTGVRGRLLAMLAISIVLFIVVPASRHPGGKLKAAAISALAIVGFVQAAQWMEQARGIGGGDSGSLIDSFDLVSPSSAIFEWVGTYGQRYLLSLSDLVTQAPPSFVSPNPGRPAFLQLVDALNQNGSGVAVTSVAELYYNLGWIIGLLAMFGFGYLFGRVQRRLEGRASSAATVMLVMLGPVTAEVFTRGYLWGTVTTYLQVTVFVLVVSRLARGPFSSRIPAVANATD